MTLLAALAPLTPASAVYAAAYTLGVAAFCLFARQRRLLTDGMLTVAAIGLVGGLIGANLGQLLATGGNPGKSVLGGIAGGYLAVWLGKKRLGLVRPTGDLFAVALMAGEAVGRARDRRLAQRGRGVFAVVERRAWEEAGRDRGEIGRAHV